MKLEELVNKNYHQLSDNDLYIWKYITLHKKECMSLSIDELANRTHVSRTTVLRFAKRLGLRGYAELKVYLRMSQQTPGQETEGLDIIYNNYASYMSSIKEQNFNDVLSYIHNAKNLYVYSTGHIQNNVASEIRRSFLNINKLVLPIHVSEDTFCYEELVSHDDVVIVVTYSGNNSWMLNFVKKMKIKGVKIISISATRQNELSLISDFPIFVDVPNILNPLGQRYEGLVNYFILIDFIMAKYIDCYGRGEAV